MAHFRSITVAELRDLLEGQEDDAVVIFSTDYGDRGHTRQALPLTGNIEEVPAPVETGYSNSGYAFPDDEDDYDEEDEEDGEEEEKDERTFVLIS